jgi:hypothetical protein
MRRSGVTDYVLRIRAGAWKLTLTTRSWPWHFGARRARCGPTVVWLGPVTFVFERGFEPCWSITGSRVPW